MNAIALGIALAACIGAAIPIALAVARLERALLSESMPPRPQGRDLLVAACFGIGIAALAFGLGSRLYLFVGGLGLYAAAVAWLSLDTLRAFERETNWRRDGRTDPAPGARAEDPRRGRA